MRETISVLISLPRDVHHVGRTEAIKRGVSFSQFVATLVRAEAGLPPPERNVQKAAPRQASAMTLGQTKAYLAEQRQEAYRRDVAFGSHVYAAREQAKRDEVGAILEANGRRREAERQEAAALLKSAIKNALLSPPALEVPKPALKLVTDGDK